MSLCPFWSNSKEEKPRTTISLQLDEILLIAIIMVEFFLSLLSFPSTDLPNILLISQLVSVKPLPILWSEFWKFTPFRNPAYRSEK
jgi:hypothetical protein